MAREYDPVCGMLVDDATVRNAMYDGKRYVFCTDGCLDEFLQDPGRFIVWGSETERAGSQTSVSGSATEVVYLRRCMACGEEAQAPVSLDTLLGRRTIDEVESFVHGRWRKRLGQSAYRRSHSRALIRALVVYALQPTSPVRGRVIDVGLDLEMASLRAAGLNHQQARRELRYLSRSIREGLADSGLASHMAHRMATMIADRIAAWNGTNGRIPGAFSPGTGEHSARDGSLSGQPGGSVRLANENPLP